jgi:hypothetical protein
LDKSQRNLPILWSKFQAIFPQKIIRSPILNVAFTVWRQLLARITPEATRTDFAVAFCAEATIIVPRIPSEWDIGRHGQKSSPGS